MNDWQKRWISPSLLPLGSKSEPPCMRGVEEEWCGGRLVAPWGMARLHESRCEAAAAAQRLSPTTPALPGSPCRHPWAAWSTRFCTSKTGG